MPLSIKTLQQFALKVHNFAYGTEWDDEDIVSAMAFDEIIEKMIKDEKNNSWHYVNGFRGRAWVCERANRRTFRGNFVRVGN